MRKLLFSALAFFALTGANAQNFDDYFENKSLRLDYIFAGNANSQSIYLEEMKSLPTWAGRRTRLSEKYLNGNGQVTVRDHETKEVIYVNSFSTLFQEWQSTEEATKVSKAFEASYLVPFPKKPIDVTITMTDVHQKVSAELTHTIDPTDILIRPTGENNIPTKYILQSGSTDKCVDIAIVAEGYTEADMTKFYEDAQRATDAIFSHEPFKSMKNKFNVVAVASPSLDSGPCIPRDGNWKRSAVNAHYDTFYSDRYLMTQDIHKVYDLLTNVPFEQVIVLVNSATYGGGGIFNQVTLSTTNHSTFKQVLVHEFGHGYAGLGDEYFYDDQYSSMYPADTEPWEPNLTTLVNFDSKWKDLVPAGTAIPTPPADIPNFKTIKPDDKKSLKKINDATQVVGVFEGGGYQSKGVYRPAQECRMKINEVEYFCPVCYRAIQRITDFYTGN